MSPLGGFRLLSLTPLRVLQVSAGFSGQLLWVSELIPPWPSQSLTICFWKDCFRFGDIVTEVAVRNHVPFPLPGAAAGAAWCHLVLFRVVCPGGWAPASLRQVPLCLVTFCALHLMGM